MGQISTVVLPAATIVRNYAQGLLKGMTPTIFARKPNVGGKVIEINHPAFNYGHLALYPAKIFTMLNIDVTAIATPVEWEALFKNGAACQDDVNNKIYPSMDVITSSFFKGYDAVLERLANVDDSSFTKVMPDEARRAKFPTVGAFIVHLLTGHANMHLGQVSGWRRCMDLGPA